eukprot:360148-Chlamydomonas_euryale.AAC.1
MSDVRPGVARPRDAPGLTRAPVSDVRPGVARPRGAPGLTRAPMAREDPKAWPTDHAPEICKSRQGCSVTTSPHTPRRTSTSPLPTPPGTVTANALPCTARAGWS